MLHKYFSRFLTVLITVVGLFVGCINPAGEDGGVSVYHKWKNEYDGYEISTDYIKYNDGGYGYNWEGEIKEVTSSYIYFKYKVIGNKIDESLMNNFCAVMYKGLRENSCSFSNAYKENGKTATETLEEAKTEFTQENGYFASFSECVIAD